MLDPAPRIPIRPTFKFPAALLFTPLVVQMPAKAADRNPVAENAPAGASTAPQLATITIETEKVGAPVPRSLYGIFFEEVNHAGDGGLYAELIHNRSFDATLPIEGCTLVDGKCKATSSPCYFTGKIKNWSRLWQFSSPWPGWSLVKPQAAAVNMSIETENPLNPSNTTYLRLTLSALPGRESVRLLNEGY